MENKKTVESFEVINQEYLKSQNEAIKAGQILLNNGYNFEKIEINNIRLLVSDGKVTIDDSIPF